MACFWRLLQWLGAGRDFSSNSKIPKGLQLLQKSCVPCDLVSGRAYVDTDLGLRPGAAGRAGIVFLLYGPFLT